MGEGGVSKPTKVEKLIVDFSLDEDVRESLARFAKGEIARTDVEKMVREKLKSILDDIGWEAKETDLE